MAMRGGVSFSGFLLLLGLWRFQGVWWGTVHIIWLAGVVFIILGFSLLLVLLWGCLYIGSFLGVREIKYEDHDTIVCMRLVVCVCA